MKSIIIIFVIHFTLPFVLQLNIPLQENGILNTKQGNSESVLVNSRKNASGIMERIKKDTPRDNYQLTRDAYEREVNDSIADYYAQRKAVMDRYHARQREIAARFTGRRPETTMKTTTTTTTTEPTTVESRFDENYDGSDGSVRVVKDIQWSYVNQHNPGYHQIGNLRNTSDEGLVYQHNIGIGIRGKSELDAVVEVLLDDPIRITFVELIPFNNSRADLDHISGGPGYNNVKLKLTPQRNSGLSYTVKIWGLKN